MVSKVSKTLRHRTHQLLSDRGETYAHEAGIPLKDTPSPLYQLLVLSTLLSARITSEIAIDAAREIFHAGWRTVTRSECGSCCRSSGATDSPAGGARPHPAAR